MPRKAKQPAEPVEINFEEVYESIKEPEHLKMSNIFGEIRYTPKSEAKGEMAQHNPYSRLYYEYKIWLREQGYSEWDFR